MRPSTLAPGAAQLKRARLPGVFHLPDDLRVLDLDGPRELLHRGLRLTQILARNLAVTQQWGHDIWGEKDPGDPSSRRWQGVAWWSYHRPTWQVLASWKQPELVHIEPLDLSHPAVADAAGALRRPLMM